MAENKVTIEVAIEGNAKAQFKVLTTSVDTFQKKTKKSLADTSRIFDNFVANVASNAVGAAFRGLTNVAGKLFNTFIVDGVKAAQVQEDAINELNQALKASGQFTQGASDELQAYASELQQASKFGDETIISTQALLQNLGQLDKEGLKQATQASLDLAAALGIDLKAATLLVGKAATGEVSSFSRYGLIIKKASTNAETFQNVLKKVNDQFGGAAASQVQTFSGATTQLSNTFGDLTETVGESITKNATLVSIVKEVGKIINEQNSSLKGNKSAFAELVSDGIITALDAFIGLAQGLDLFNRVAEVVFNSFKLIGLTSFAVVQTAILAFVKTINAVADAIPGISAPFEDVERILEAGLENLTEQAKTAAGNINTAFSEETFLEGAIKGLKRVRDEAAKTTGEIMSSQEELAEQEEASRAIASDRATEAEEKKIEEEEKALVARQTKNAKIIDIETKQALTETKISQFSASQIASVEDNLDKTILKGRVVSDAKRKELVLKGLNFDKKIREQRFAAANTALSNLATLSNSKNKELAAVGKAAAITQATISTFLGAQLAFSSLAGIPIVGPVLGGIAAAAAIIAGVARVAQISGTPLQTGLTQVPGGFSNDTFSARLSTGERVVSAPQNQDLTGFLASSEGLGAKLDILIGLQADREPIVVNVGGNELIDTIQDELDSGRSLNV